MQFAQLLRTFLHRCLPMALQQQPERRATPTIRLDANHQLIAKLRGFFALIAGIILVVGCSTQRIVPHTFSFDIGEDKSNVEVIEWIYGKGSEFYQRRSPKDSADGRIGQRTAVGGFMPLGTKIYVKWRDNATQKIYQETAEFSSRLPNDPTDGTIHFSIIENRLTVFFVTRDFRKPDEPINGPSMYHHWRVVRIYP